MYPRKLSLKIRTIGALFLIGLSITAGCSLLTKTTAPTPPATLILPVPFSAQAPRDNWEYNKDCEETSIVMANAYLSGNEQKELPASEAEKAIKVLKNWEQSNIGHNADTGANETEAMAEGAFKMQVNQIRDFTAEDLKKELAQNHVILLPINAGVLNNPKYSDGGNFYHMIVIRGYNEKGFVVNDPGTNEGNGNVYSFETLQKAAADWNNGKMMMDGTRKIALVLWK